MSSIPLRIYHPLMCPVFSWTQVKLCILTIFGKEWHRSAITCVWIPSFNSFWAWLLSASFEAPLFLYCMKQWTAIFFFPLHVTHHHSVALLNFSFRHLLFSRPKSPLCLLSRFFIGVIFLHLIIFTAFPWFLSIPSVSFLEIKGSEDSIKDVSEPWFDSVAY